ncbi:MULTISPECIES: asparagine synthase-related protein [Actinomadura]|uniref:asparagine synthase (glutamine-hydrolyzing) n=1 Tax=Actinomadura yumaensis TaxID=111807 RepID=A0ABW2CDF3_9ACTN|nr:asparagine synthase-related protein [Actinomadura sp. J1-007]MWK38211.1 hypothetical protein [Actinomadura sp. J1-007]
MRTHGDPGWYFVMLPDVEDAGTVAARLPGAGTLAVHPSGRPWIVGNVPSDQVLSGVGRAARVTVLGYSSATPALLDAEAGRLSSVEGLDELGRTLDGGFHLLGAVRGRLRAQGSASGARRVHHALIDGLPVASDRSDVLAGLGGFSLDERGVAITLLRGLPPSFAERPLWRGVAGVEPGSALVVERDGRRRIAVWWRPPEAELSRAEGARRLRRALAGSVDARTAAGGTVHCDLSGGLDSTPLCYLASRGPAEVIAHTGYNGDPSGGDDLAWARKALPAMPGVRHETFRMEELPGFFEGVRDAAHRMDEPSQAYLAGPRMAVSAARARERGARAYLTGLGGDHLLRSLPAVYHTLFRRRPLLALRRIRAVQCLEGRPVREMAGELLSGRSYARWLSDQVRAMRSGREPGPELTLAWGPALRPPPWLTDDAADLLAEHLGELAAKARPLGPTRAAHAQLATVLDGARISRGVQQLGGCHGIALESPFFDDRVVEACLSVRPAERDAPTEYKPLIKDAMRGALPEGFLARDGKAGGAPQAARGLDRHWEELMELCEESGLAGSGLVDMRRLREHGRPGRHRRRDAALDPTINCAAFLKAQRDALAVPAVDGGA